MDRYQLSKPTPSRLRSAKTPPAEQQRTDKLTTDKTLTKNSACGKKPQVDFYLPPSRTLPKVVNHPGHGAQKSYSDIKPLLTPVSRFYEGHKVAWELEVDQPQDSSEYLSDSADGYSCVMYEDHPLQEKKELKWPQTTSKSVKKRHISKYIRH